MQQFILRTDKKTFKKKKKCTYNNIFYVICLKYI